MVTLMSDGMLIVKMVHVVGIGRLVEQQLLVVVERECVVDIY
jgi:hypothetical protein